MNYSGRVSVAMATYNGEKYIEEQLRSICSQTRKPDEIVVSDDGSKDSTLEIVDRVAKSECAQGIDFIVITDNPRHGYCGNFEWAIKHTTGDLIFLSDQDDVWLPEKVERICNVKVKHPDAQCIIHNAKMIDENGTPVDGDFHRVIKLHEVPCDKNGIAHLTQEKFLEPAISSTLANGMVMCITRDILPILCPFPKTLGMHDAWIGFSAVLQDTCWYLSVPLTLYRLHGENTCGNSAKTKKLSAKIKSGLRRASQGNSSVLERVEIGNAMITSLIDKGLQNSDAYSTACKVHEIGKIQAAAFSDGGISGALKLLVLFFTNVRYRRSGKADFILQLLVVLRNRDKAN